MTYSLNTLHGTAHSDSASTAPRRRFVTELVLLATLVGWVAVVVALASYAPQDAAWSTSGSGEATRNRVGGVGAWVADVLYFLLGGSAWWLLLAALRAWVRAARRWRARHLPVAESPPTLQRRTWISLAGLVLLLMASTALEWARFASWEARLPGHAGGVLGYVLGTWSVRQVGFTLQALVCIMLGVVTAALTFGFSWLRVAEALGGWIETQVRGVQQRRAQAEDEALGQRAAQQRAEDLHRSDVLPEETEEPPPVPVAIEPVVLEVPQSERQVRERQKPLFVELPDSALPQVDLLDGASNVRETVAPETLEMTSRMIEKRLRDFGVDVHVVLAQPGPVITRYEIEPATGVKGAQIVALAKDLARSLSLVSIRVVETIPGKTTMALELPNARRQTIRLAEILGSQTYAEAKSLLTVGLGKDILGNPVLADLAKMPHLLVAGTTGSGKSVGVNAMIMSILYKAEARDVRFLMIDPKMLEMSFYEGIPHLLAPVVTDMKQAAYGLSWCVAEMERRYRLLSRLGVRNLNSFNAKVDEARARGAPLLDPFALPGQDAEPLDRLPYIVVVIDELADLMMVIGKKIEELIARLAQKARAAGIHLVLATQRPSVDVITGLIKANIPTRIAFQVSSKIDSRTILDQMGAEALLGMGDMLYLPSGTGLPMRVHGAFVSDDEVHRVVAYLKAQGQPNYLDGVLEAPSESENVPGVDGAASGEKDALYDQAVEIVLKDRKASISYVQRKLRIGYNRAARLLEDMEKAGLVGALSSAGQRDILVPPRGD